MYTAAIDAARGFGAGAHGRRKLLLISLALRCLCIVNALSPTIESCSRPRYPKLTLGRALIIGQAMLRDLPTKKREGRHGMSYDRLTNARARPSPAARCDARLAPTFWAPLALAASSFYPRSISPESLPKERRQPKFSPYNLHSVCFNAPPRLPLLGGTRGVGLLRLFCLIATSSYIPRLLWHLGRDICLLHCLCFLGATAGSFATHSTRWPKLSPHSTYTLGLTLQSLCALALASSLYAALPSAVTSSEVVLQSASSTSLACCAGKRSRV